jgi:predicted branched-subunit amino acid permease
LAESADAAFDRGPVLRASLGVGLATGAYGVSFGAISVASGFSILQTCLLSLLLFSGGSQFALVGIMGAGGSAASAASTAILLGTRNAFYGVRLASLLRAVGLKRFVAAQLVIDESTAVATGQESERAGRMGFWATGVAVFALWNLATFIGALGAHAMSDPTTFGLDAAAPAAFLALLAPRMRSKEPWAVALAAAAIALIAAPYLPVGVPILLAALPAVVAGLRWRTARSAVGSPAVAARGGAASRDGEGGRGA